MSWFKSLILINSGLIGLFFAFQINAQGTGITISPLTFELSVNPGNIITNTIKVSNSSDSAVSVKMEAEDFVAIGEEGKVVTTSEEDKTYSLREWITIIPSEFTLEKDSDRMIDFIIEVPQNAEPGGKYGSVLASVTGSLQEGVTGTAITTKTGSLVLLMVAGELKENLNIKEFSVPSFQEYGPVPFEIRFENTGTVHVKPKGYIVITNLFGKNVKELEFPQENVMPEAVRKIEVKWDTKWLFGKYTATIFGVYGVTNQNIDPYVVTFWVLPWKIILAVVLVLTVILLFFYKTRKRWKLAIKILVKGEKISK